MGIEPGARAPHSAEVETQLRDTVRGRGALKPRGCVEASNRLWLYDLHEASSY